MRRPRTLAAAALVLLAACLAVGVPRASAVDPFPTSGVTTLTSDHFMIHYSRVDDSTDCPTVSITQQTAGDILGWAERAYSYYTSWGYATPVLDNPDGDPYIDIAADEFDKPAPTCIVYGNIDPSIPVDGEGTLKRWDALVNPVAPLGAIEIHLQATGLRGISYHAVAKEVFQLFALKADATADPWLRDATAEWAATHTDGALGGVETNPDRTIDCVGTECGDTDFDRNGGWMLFQYLAEHYGNTSISDGDPAIVKAVWDQAVANPGAPGTTDLAAVLPSGVTLSQFFNDFATARLTGNFKFEPLAGVLPSAFAEVAVPESTAGIPATSVAVNHMAARYLTFKHGTGTGPCYEASLTLNVAIPAGVESAPAYYANTLGATAQPLTISGSTASITVPWNTCADSPDAYLSLPNATLGLDGREFVVTGSVSVDRTKPSTPSPPPPGTKVIGNVIPAPMSDPAPTLRIYAPEVLRVSARNRLLRFAVFSSGDGKLQAVLGSANLGTATLRGGNNDVRFVLPQALFKGLRVKSAANLLQLTSVSPGGTKGATVTRRVLVQTPKPKKRR
jgi:hypothetical protein